MSDSSHEWQERSRQALVGEVRRLAALLEGQGADTPEPPENTALARLTRKFALSGFERDVLLMCAAVELDSGFARLVASRQGGERAFVTFSLALSVLPNAHWSALAQNAVLRQARLIRVAEGTALVNAPIHIEEPALHFLNGMAGLDARLRPFVSPLEVSPLPPSHEETAARLAESWNQRMESGERKKVFLAGEDGAAARSIAAWACAAIGFCAFAADLAALPAERTQLEELCALWERDAVLYDYALLIDGRDTETPERRATLSWLLDRLHGTVAVSGERSPVAHRSAVLRIAVGQPSPAEQEQLWRDALGSMAASVNGQLGRLVEQFRLTPRAIVEAAGELRLEAAKDPGARIWSICRSAARGGMDDLAHCVEARAGWEDLVLPEPQVELLRSIAMSVRHRRQVHEDWGFRARSSRGLGVSAAFFGASGVGKTLAAEVLAGELELDLYRIDLSAAVSKYIGETEKNLRRVFDAAEASGAILLFDEADALFGKRTEVKDSHDRYSNLEVSYLLQRMEAYRGLAILTSNLKSALDSAFLRRIRFVVQFPFPAAAERQRIWQRAFPSATPLDPAIDWDRLSRLAVAGGNIANIALDAAFRAAGEGSHVTMRHLAGAARAECAKIEKPLSENEMRGWV